MIESGASQSHAALGGERLGAGTGGVTGEGEVDAAAGVASGGGEGARGSGSGGNSKHPRSYFYLLHFQLNLKVHPSK